MRRLNQNTLVDIARHSNKTLKMADFMVRAGYPFLYGEMARVESETPAIEAIEAFKKDIEKTAAQMEQVHELLSTVDENNNVIYLKNDEKNLSKIFGDAYDTKNKVINFSNYSLKLKVPFAREDFLNEITTSLVGQSYSDFREMFKARNKTFKLDDKSLYTDEDKIYFLSIIKDREQYSKVVDKIRGYGEGFGQYRSNLSLEEKNQIDNEITFNRSMIDSVTQNSTYLTKEDGIVKLGSPHKKEKDNINKIVNFLKDNDFIKAIELDPETSLEGVIDVLNKTREINFNLDNEVVFKVRKLGNYKANGLYMNSQKIVAVDIKNPSAAIHEFVHAVDLGRDDIRHSQQREDIASKYRSRIDTDILPESHKDYYLKTSEIIARLGEIGFILNQYDYKENETINEFQERVLKEEQKDKPYDLNLAKSVDTYFNKMENEYFNVKSMSKDNLMEVKSYYQSYFGVKNNEIKPINLIQVDPEEQKGRIVRKIQKHQLKPVSFFSADNIQFALNYNKKEQLIDFPKLLSAIFENPVDINRTVKKYNTDTLIRQKAFFEKLGNWIKEEKNPYLTSEALKSLYSIDRNARYKVAHGVKDAFLNNKRFVTEEIFSEEVKRLNEIKEEKADFLSRNKRTPNAKYTETMRNLRRESANLTRQVSIRFTEMEKEKFPELEEQLAKRDEAYVTERTASGNRYKFIDSTSSANLFQGFRETMKSAMVEQDPERVLSCLEKDDLMIFDLLSNESLRGRMFGQINMGNDQVENILKSGMENGLIESLVKNKDGAYQGYTFNRAGYNQVIELNEKIEPMGILEKLLPETLKGEFVNIEDFDKKLSLIEINTESKALNKGQVEKLKEDYIFENKTQKTKNDLRNFVSKKENYGNEPVKKPVVPSPKEEPTSKKSPKGQMKLF